MHAMNTLAPQRAVQKTVLPQQQQRLARALQYMVEHAEEAPTLETVARVAGYSRFHFHRLFRLQYGKPVKRVAAELQLDRAKQLILQGLAFGEVAKRCGFSHQSHFTARFKQMTGQTPREWRYINRVNKGE